MRQKKDPRGGGMGIAIAKKGGQGVSREAKGEQIK